MSDRSFLSLDRRGSGEVVFLPLPGEGEGWGEGD